MQYIHIEGEKERDGGNRRLQFASRIEVCSRNRRLLIPSSESSLLLFSSSDPAPTIMSSSQPCPFRKWECEMMLIYGALQFMMLIADLSNYDITTFREQLVEYSFRKWEMISGFAICHDFGDLTVKMFQIEMHKDFRLFSICIIYFRFFFASNWYVS